MMSMVRTIDRYLYGLFQKLPHLTTPVRLSFAKDLWIAAVLFLILYVVQFISYSGYLISLGLRGQESLSSTLATPMQVMGMPVEGLALVTVFIYTLYLMLIVGLLIRSIKPIRKGFREGWLAFLAAILLIFVGSIISSIIGILTAQQILSSLVVSLLFIYILYEIRQEYKI